MSIFKKTIIIALFVIMSVCLLAQSKVKELELIVNPNPMKEFTSISFDLESTQDINLVITSEKGIVLKTLFNGTAEKGIHHYSWDGTDYTNSRLPEGTYVVELSFDAKFTSVKKIIILK